MVFTLTLLLILKFEAIVVEAPLVERLLIVTLEVELEVVVHQRHLRGEDLPATKVAEVSLICGSGEDVLGVHASSFELLNMLLGIPVTLEVLLAEPALTEIRMPTDRHCKDSISVMRVSCGNPSLVRVRHPRITLDRPVEVMCGPGKAEGLQPQNVPRVETVIHASTCARILARVLGFALERVVGFRIHVGL